MPGIHGQSWEPPKLRASNELVVTKEADLAYCAGSFTSWVFSAGSPFHTLSSPSGSKRTCFRSPLPEVSQAKQCLFISTAKKGIYPFPATKKGQPRTHTNCVTVFHRIYLYKNQCLQIKMPLDPNNPGSISSFQPHRSK